MSLWLKEEDIEEDFEEEDGNKMMRKLRKIRDRG